MSNQINLSRLNIASEPFRNRTLPWLVAVLVAFVSLVVLVYLIGESQAANARANVQASQVQKLKQQEKELKAKVDTVNQALTPEQKQLLVASHELVDRKYFSWSWLFEDLESVLPSDTKVTRINVRDVKQIDGRTVAELELALMSKSYVNVTGMIESMDRSGVFQSELTEQNLQKGDQKNLTEYTLRIIYHQRAGLPAEPSASESHSGTVAGVTGGLGGKQ